MIGWEKIRFLGNSKIVKNNYIWIFLVPVMFKILTFTSESMSFINIELPIKLPFSWVMLYFSALFFSFGHLIYLLFCPQIIQKFSGYSEYKELGFRMINLNGFIHKKLTNGDSINNLLMNKLHELSEETGVDDIDKNITSVIEINKDNLYNIKNIYENELFWYLYKMSDKLNVVFLIISSAFFMVGFLLLAKVLYDNLLFMISIA